MSFNEYHNYLKEIEHIPDDKVHNYLGWSTRFFAFCKKQPGERFNQHDVDSFLSDPSRQKEAWQVEQKREAIELYRHLINRKDGKASLEGFESRISILNRYSSASAAKGIGIDAYCWPNAPYQCANHEYGRGRSPDTGPLIFPWS